MKLVEALRRFSSQYNLQIVFTTHSLTILEEMCVHQENPKIQGQVKVIYLQKEDSHVKAIEGISIDEIKNKLNVTLPQKQKTKKISVFVEDKEGEIFAKAVLKRRSSSLQFVQCTMGCSNYIELARKKIGGFKYLQSIIILDGDVKSESSKMRELKKYKNFLVLPGTESPEKLIAKFLYNLSEASPLWDKIHNGYTKQLVFRDHPLIEIQADREKAKAWFNSQKQYRGRGCAGVVNLWISEHQEEVSNFIDEYDRLIQKYI